MEIIVLGSGVWIGNRSRKRYGPALLVETEEKKILVDCSSGTGYRLAEAGVEANQLEIILLTHLHPDHSAGLLPLIGEMYLTSRKNKLRVFGPEGTLKFIEDSRKVYAETFGDIERKTAFEIEIKEVDTGKVCSEGPLKISSAGLEHIAYCRDVGYVLEENGKKLVITGDTGYCDSLEKLAANADLLVCECSHNYPTKWHLCPEEIAKLATVTRVKKIALVHIYPDCDADAAAVEIMEGSGSKVIAGMDLKKIPV